MSRTLMAMEGMDGLGGLEGSSLSSLENIIITSEEPRAALVIMGKQIHLFIDTRATYSILALFSGKSSSQPTIVTEVKGHVDAIHIPKQTVTNAKGHQETQ